MIEEERMATGIEGVWLMPLAIIPASGGPVLHMLRSSYRLMPSLANGFGEIYFSEVLPGCIKAWKLHERQKQHIAVPTGQILIALCDNRIESPTFGHVISMHLGRPDNYNLLAIPPGIWYGFKAVSSTSALICNYADIAHDPHDSRRLPFDTERIPFSWQ